VGVNDVTIETLSDVAVNSGFPLLRGFSIQLRFFAKGENDEQCPAKAVTATEACTHPAFFCIHCVCNPRRDDPAIWNGERRSHWL
jgi:hypothetical protein